MRDQQLNNLNSLLQQEQQRIQQMGSFLQGSNDPVVVLREIENVRLENE
jgi:hypothetical protein